MKIKFLENASHDIKNYFYSELNFSITYRVEKIETSYIIIFIIFLKKKTYDVVRVNAREREI